MKMKSKLLKQTYEKMKNNAAMESFYCFVCKIWKKSNLCCITRRGKTPGLHCFLNAKN